MLAYRGLRPLPWDDELISVEIDDWLPVVLMTIDQIQAERQGSGREIKLGQGMHNPGGG